MTDRVSPEVRSRIMSRIRGKDTKPEILVRRLMHGMGYRYRLHRRDLPGTRDLTFPARSKIIFVHGCFRHDCSRGVRPASNTEFWNAKLDRNVRRDRENLEALRDDGWSVLVLWECETKDHETLTDRILEFLGPPGRQPDERGSAGKKSGEHA